MSDVRLLVLYSPSIALMLWAAVWAAGIQGDGVLVAGLSLTAAAVVLHVREHIREHTKARRHRGRPA